MEEKFDFNTLDKDVIEPCKRLTEEGLKTTFSCDGVLSHHEGRFQQFDRFYYGGYISFEWTDKNKLLSFISNAYSKGMQIGFNIDMPFERDSFQIGFHNINGEFTEVLNKTISDTFDNKIIYNNDDYKFVENLYKISRRYYNFGISFMYSRENIDNILVIKNALFSDEEMDNDESKFLHVKNQISSVGESFKEKFPDIADNISIRDTHIFITYDNHLDYAIEMIKSVDHATYQSEEINDEFDPETLDKDVIEPCKKLTREGLQTTFSCDGVIEHHKNEYNQLDLIYYGGYISFKGSEKEEKTLRLLSNMYSQKQKIVFCSSQGSNEDIEFSYSINFHNPNREFSDQLNKTIEDSIDKNIVYSEDDYNFVKQLYDSIHSINKYYIHFMYGDNPSFNALLIYQKRNDNGYKLEYDEEMKIKNNNIELYNTLMDKYPNLKDDIHKRGGFLQIHFKELHNEILEIIELLKN